MPTVYTGNRVTGLRTSDSVTSTEANCCFDKGSLLAQLNFFAVTSDIELVLDFIFEQTDCRVFEAYSRPAHRLREFSSLAELQTSDVLEVNHGRYFLRMIPRGVGTEPKVRTFKLKKTGQKRSEINAPAMFQIVQGGPAKPRSQAIVTSTFSHWNEAGARQRSLYPNWLLARTDWKYMRRVSGRIHRHIKNKLAVAKVGFQPVLPGAFEQLGDTLYLADGPNKLSKDSPELEIL